LIRRTDLNIFLLALLFAGADSFLMALEPIFASSDSTSFFVTSVAILGGLSPLILLSYLIHPSLFFIVVYFASMKSDLGKHYVAVSLSLFFGGISGVLVGSLLGLYAQLVALSSTSTGATSQLVAGIGPIFAGLFAFFAGFSATSLAHLKAQGHQG